jgi:hypothetical protein
MSKKRQTRNTKKMQKALGSKRSRAGYRVGGAIKEDARVSNPRQRPVLTNQEIGTVSNNRPVSSLISEFQQPIAKAPQESITKGVPFIPSETEIQPLTPVITKPTMPSSKEVPVFPSIGGIGGGTVPTQPQAAPVSDQTLTPVMPKPTAPPLKAPQEIINPVTRSRRKTNSTINCLGYIQMLLFYKAVQNQ